MIAHPRVRVDRRRSGCGLGYMRGDLAVMEEHLVGTGAGILAGGYKERRNSYSLFVVRGDLLRSPVVPWSYDVKNL